MSSNPILGYGGGPGFGATGDVTPATDITSATLLDSTSEQPTDNVDLLLDDDGDLFVDTDIHFTSGLVSVAQGIKIRMQTFKGEWFLDLDHGVPYWQHILGHKFNERKIRAAFRDAILTAPGVQRLLELTVEFNAGTRELTVEWKAQTIFGVTSDELILET